MPKKIEYYQQINTIMLLNLNLVKLFQQRQHQYNSENNNKDVLNNLEEVIIRVN